MACEVKSGCRGGACPSRDPAVRQGSAGGPWPSPTNRIKNTDKLETMPMEENKKLPQRKKTHLKPSMYLDGWYFVTMVAVGREHIFSKIEINGKIKLLPVGKTAVRCVKEIPEHFPGVRVYKAIVMPDHLHMVVYVPPNSYSLHTVIGGFKGAVSKATGRPVWQRSYYDHVIRGRQDFIEICRYIEDNPRRWMEKHESGL